MKIFATALLIFLSIFSIDATTSIKIKINQGSEEDIIYYMPFNGEFTLISRQNIKTDKDGIFNISVDLKEAGFFYIFPQLKFEENDWKGIQVFAAPNSSMVIGMDKDRPDESLKFEGDFADLNTTINKFERHFLLYFENSDKLERLYIENAPLASLELIDSLKTIEFEQIKAIPELTEEASNLLKEDISSYYTEAFYTLLLRYGDIEDTDRWAIKEEWMEVIKNSQMLDEINQRSASSLWHQSSLNLKRNYLNQVHFEKFQNATEGLKESEKQWQVLSMIFTDSELRSYFGHKLFHLMYKSQFDEKTLYTYEQFKAQFSNYPYFEVLSKPFEEQLKFKEKSEEKIHLSTKSFNSLKELAAETKVDFIFLDIWATWCGPCIREFSKSSPLKDFIKENSDKIAMVYVSFDENKPAIEIEQVINYHKLEAFNVLASESLRIDIANKLGDNGRMLLPTYSLIDKDGAVIKKRTKAPSQWEKLEKEISRVLSKSNG